MPAQLQLDLDLNQVILALADALDLVGVDETAHGKRVGYMAFMCGIAQGLDQAGCERLFNLGLLHDIGVSSSREHTHLVTEMQWEGAQDHAGEGARLLRGFGPFADFAAAIHYHHTEWQELCRLAQLPQQVRLDANLIFLVDRLDALAASHYGKDLLEHTATILDAIDGLGGSLFAPELVALLHDAAASDAFWMTLEPPHLERFITDLQRCNGTWHLDAAQMRQLAGIFAHVVDAKSPFTVSHSDGVAALARHLAGLAGLEPATQDKIELAGLLHDIGKLRIPDEILEKPGPLSDKEKRIMHRHSFETYQVLRHIDGLADIALWAAYHHETTDGLGYPFRRGGNELSIEARIIAVADIFQALAQERPYRHPMATRQIVEHLQHLAAAGKLDSDIVALATNDATACHHAATAAHPPLS